MLPILYSFRRCPYAIRTRMTLSYAGIECELREVKLQAKPAALIEASSKATVPVLVLEDRVLDESLDIMDWALAQQDRDRWRSADPLQRNAQLALIEECDRHFKPLLDQYKYADRHPTLSRDQHRALACEFPAQLETRLNAAYLFGNQLSIADVAIFPFIRQFAFVDIRWFQQSAYPRLQRWLQQLLDHPLFTGVMAKHPPWQPGDPLTRFPETPPADTGMATRC